jgi:flagellar protein FlgJ
MVQPKDPQAIHRVAVQFDPLLVSQLLKQMRQTLQPNGMFAGDSGDVQGGLFDMFLGQHLAQAGGFGIAAMMERQLTTPDDTPSTQALGPGQVK